MPSLKDILISLNTAEDETHSMSVTGKKGNISSVCDGHPAILIFYLYHHLRDEGYTMQHVADVLSLANSHYEYIQQQQEGDNGKAGKTSGKNNPESKSGIIMP